MSNFFGCFRCKKFKSKYSVNEYREPENNEKLKVEEICQKCEFPISCHIINTIGDLHQIDVKGQMLKSPALLKELVCPAILKSPINSYGNNCLQLVNKYNSIKRNKNYFKTPKSYGSFSRNSQLVTQTEFSNDCQKLHKMNDFERVLNLEHNISIYKVNII